MNIRLAWWKDFWLPPQCPRRRPLLHIALFIACGACLSLDVSAQDSACKNPLLVEEPGTLGGHLAISTDSTLLATDADDGYGAVMDITVRDLATGDAVRRWSFPQERLQQLCFIDKSRLLVAGSDSGTLRLLNPDTGEVVTKPGAAGLSPILGFDCPVNGGAALTQFAVPRGTIEWFSKNLEPSGKFETLSGTTLIASATLHNQALVLTKTMIAEQPPGVEDVLSGNEVTTTNYALLMVSAQDNAVLWRTELSVTPQDSVILDRSGSVGAWMDEAGYLHIVNARSGEETHRVKLAPFAFPRFTLSEQGRFLVISQLGELHSFVVDVQAGKVINETLSKEILALGEDGSPRLLRMPGNEGLEIASVSKDGAVAQRVQGRLQIPSLVPQPPGRLFLSGQKFDYSLSIKERKITPFSKPVDVVATHAAWMAPDTTLRIYERSDGNWSFGNQNGTDEPVRLPANSKGLSVATLGESSGLLMASVTEEDLERIKTAVEAWSDTIGENATASELNSVLLSTNTTLYEVDFTGAAKKTLSLRGAVSAMAISADQQSIARFQPPDLQVFDARTGKSTFKTVIPDVTTMIEFSPTHPWIAFTRDPNIEVWDWRKNRLVKTITRERALGDGFAFSADGQSLIYADGATVHVTSLPTPHAAKVALPAHAHIDYKADGAVGTITALNDNLFAGLSSSGAVNIWKIGQAAPKARLIFEKSGAWTVIDDKGRFDTSAIETNNAVHLYSAGNTAHRLSLQTCRDVSWIPGLLNEVLAETVTAP
ncbi:WD40 repeat domain-containing protein [Pseudomonas sichuanensis]|uniref:WD40 repeat domain-containing protein n=1 Tax=Pseudomonas sichuanensis TaxID=2213015 RepID=UPI002ABCD0AA|nr:WD40 repeat domain-containing protein [Pseudomonas sichuanensis]MDZ4017095.1 hypothetical protein [Pseudomonas sichuanensis]